MKTPWRLSPLPHFLRSCLKARYHFILSTTAIKWSDLKERDFGHIYHDRKYLRQLPIAGGGSRIFRMRGRQLARTGCHHTNFPRNFVKLRKFWSVLGAPLDLPLYWIKNELIVNFSILRTDDGVLFLLRYFAICHPMKVKTICTTRRAKLVIAVMWIVAMICAVPEIFTRVGTGLWKFNCAWCKIHSISHISIYCWANCYKHFNIYKEKFYLCPGGSLSGRSPGQRPLLERDPWTETPGIETPWTDTLGRRVSGQRTPGQRPPDRNPPG